MTEVATAGLPAVAVIGAGLMGHGIAQVFLEAGASVSIWDPAPEALSTVPARIRDHLALTGGSIASEPVLAETLADAVRDAGLVVEAIPERMRLKQSLMAQLDELAPDAIVASNTSVLRISEIAEGSRRPERIAGAHWWNPPYLIPVVELVAGGRTDEGVLDALEGWLDAAGKVTVRVGRDVPGFIGNRMQFALMREAMTIVEEGLADAATVDLVARSTFGRRLSVLGPLGNADFIGLELTRSIMDYVLPHLSSQTSTPRLVTEAIASGALGARSGRGIRDWEPGERDETERRLVRHLLEAAKEGADG